MSKCASYLNTISKQNRIKHRNRFQMLVRTCFLVDCLSLTSSIALKIVVFLKKNQYIDNVSDIPLMSLKVSWMSFLDYLLIKVTMCTIHFIVSFIELQKCQTKNHLSEEFHIIMLLYDHNHAQDPPPFNSVSF